jgi:hypothetical protein
VSHAAALMSILEREQRRQEAARLHEHEYRAAPTRNVCVDCGLGQWYTQHTQTRKDGQAR